jgi:hypothetical protein
MIKSSLPSALAVVLVLAALPVASAATGEDGHMWTGKSNGSHVSLAYGPTDQSQQPVFLLSCFNGMNVAVLDVFGAIEGTRPGQALTIELSAGSTKSLEGEASLDDQTGSMFAEASDIDLKPVLDVLKSPGPLTVKTGPTSRTLSDKGRAEAVGKFTEACELV